MKADHIVKTLPTLHEQLTPSRRFQVLIAVAVGTFMGPLDSSVVNIALPSIRSYFQVSFSSVEWVVMAYLLIISSLLLTFGRLGDLYGHKRIYIWGFVVFTIGSLLCGLAPSIGFLIAFRVLQAIGAGMLMSMGPAIVTDVAPPKERGKYMGVIAVSVSIALSTGPVLGGFLTAKFGWPSIFYINVPVGILSIILAQRVIPDSGGQGAQPFDIKGAALVFLALVAILLPLSYAEKVGWSNPYIVTSLAVGILLFVAFVFLEKRLAHPMVDLSLFKNRLFSMSNLSALLNYVAMFSVVLLMPFYLQQLRGMPPSKAGLMLIPMPLTTMLIAPISGALSDRVDTRYFSSLGMAITALGMWLLSNLDFESSNLTVVLALVTVGLGSGIFQTPNNSAIMGAVPPYRRGIASSLLAGMRNVGMVLGVAVSGAVFTSHLNYLTRKLAAAGIAGAPLKIQAFTGAMHLAFLVACGIAVLAVFTSLVRGPANVPNMH
ncbi:MFS transporter [Thermincola ferriacetica]